MQARTSEEMNQNGVTQAKKPHPISRPAMIPARCPTKLQAPQSPMNMARVCNLHGAPAYLARRTINWVTRSETNGITLMGNEMFPGREMEYCSQHDGENSTHEGKAPHCLNDWTHAGLVQ